MSWVIVGLVFVILVETAVAVVSISRTRTRERAIKQLADGTAAAARLLATALEPVVPLFDDLARQNPSIAEAVDVGRLEVERGLEAIREQAAAIERMAR